MLGITPAWWEMELEGWNTSTIRSPCSVRNELPIHLRAMSIILLFLPFWDLVGFLCRCTSFLTSPSEQIFLLSEGFSPVAVGFVTCGC